MEILLQVIDSYIKELQDRVQSQDLTIATKTSMIAQLQNELQETKEQLKVSNFTASSHYKQRYGVNH